MDAGGLEDGPDPSRRVSERAMQAPPILVIPLGGVDQLQDATQSGDLAGPVWTEEARH
jgi:hypothetical protein